MSIKVKLTTFLNAVCDPTSHRLVLLTHDVAYGLAISELRFVGLLNEAAKGGCGLLALPRLVRLTHHKDRDKSRNRVSEFACCTRLLNSHEPNIGSFQSCLRNGVYRTDRQLAAAYPEDEMERLFDCKPESYLHHSSCLPPPSRCLLQTKCLHSVNHSFVIFQSSSSPPCRRPRQSSLLSRYISASVEPQQEHFAKVLTSDVRGIKVSAMRAAVSYADVHQLEQRVYLRPAS